jgi:hypothetical protein
MHREEREEEGCGIRRRGGKGAVMRCGKMGDR